MYHDPGMTGEYAGADLSEAGSGAGGFADAIRTGAIKQGFVDADDRVGYMVGLSDPSSTHMLAGKFAQSLGDFSGFRGFFLESVYQSMIGRKSLDEFTPRYQDSTSMLNPATQMWQYQFGDVSIVRDLS